MSVTSVLVKDPCKEDYIQKILLICCSGVTFLCLVIYFYGKTVLHQWFVVSSNNQWNWIECLYWTVRCLYQLENIPPHIGFKIMIIIFNWKYRLNNSSLDIMALKLPRFHIYFTISWTGVVHCSVTRISKMSKSNYKI